MLGPVLAFGSIESVNPFLYPLALLAVFYLLRWYYADQPGRVRKYLVLMSTGRLNYVLLALGAVSLAGLIVFEVYFMAYECRVSDEYTEEVIDLAKATMDVLNRQNIPFWFDYASLLCVLRQQYNFWDHDQDFSLMYPGSDDKVQSLMDRFREGGYGVVWDESRDLLQVHRGDRPMTNNSPHIDLWMWRPDFDRDTSKRLIVTKDYTVAYRWREWDHIFPLNWNDYTWEGVSVPVPHDPHTVSDKEYSVYGGSYLDAQVFRGDCFHNFFNGRWSYTK